uniref:MyTH4 domain-containing protein n=1 Tax=Periophthalmus magnuspinnatus TaxID=409849 RepID=A0A3B4A4D0_9GOBI
MRFMGDSALRGTSEQEVVSTFLKVKSTLNVIFMSLYPGLECFLITIIDNLHVCTLSFNCLSLIISVFICQNSACDGMCLTHLTVSYSICDSCSLLPSILPQLIGEFPLMRDEAYCQLLKQLTSNTSSKPDSCSRGWRLLYILTAFHRCSEVLKPFVLKYLQQASRSAGAQYQGIAKACEQNLKKTFQYGGRIVPPNSMELTAMMAGRSSKRQLFLFPGGIERHVKLKTCSVALEVIEELCYEMGLHRLEAMEEYAVFLVTNRGQNVRPLNKHEYILDVATEAELLDPNYSFWFRRVVWTQTLKFDNELCVAMHYNQILPDYRKGLLNTLPQGKVSDQQYHQISKLSALQHRAKDIIFIPSIHELSEYIAPPLFKMLPPQQWVNMVTQHMQQVQALSPHQARAQFLGTTSKHYSFQSHMSCIVLFTPAALSQVKMLLPPQRHIWRGDGCSPSGGGPVQPHPEAQHRDQLPLCGPYPGGYELTESGTAAA